MAYASICHCRPHTCWARTVWHMHGICLQVQRRGGARRLPAERSHRERQERDADLGDREALDVAKIQGCFFCVVPGSARQAAGEVVPFLLVDWLQYFDCWSQMQVLRNKGERVDREL